MYNYKICGSNLLLMSQFSIGDQNDNKFRSAFDNEQKTDLSVNFSDKL